MNKKGFEMTFAWLFALIVGAAILVLTIYGVVKYIGVEQTTLHVETGKQIGVLLNPLEIGYEASKSVGFSIPGETRIYNKCETSGDFGVQKIPITQKQLGKWADKTDLEASFYNKYIFSGDYVEGRDFYIFSKPFEFPFKVADMIYLTSSLEEYCFYDAPKNVEEELRSLNQKNLKLAGNCTNSSSRIDVCFGDAGCDIYVNYNEGYAKKDGVKSYFALPKENAFGSEDTGMMFAAIFASNDVYECQMVRLMKRTAKLAQLYKDKSDFISRVGCNSNLNLDLLKSTAINYEDSKTLKQVSLIADDIRNKNDNAECKLW